MPANRRPPDPPRADTGSAAARWRCRCWLPDGTREDTFWITQDGADQMESETERACPGAWCEVEPVDRAEDIQDRDA